MPNGKSDQCGPLRPILLVHGGAVMFYGKMDQCGVIETNISGTWYVCGKVEKQ